jgi:hypothetical protein
VVGIGIFADFDHSLVGPLVTLSLMLSAFGLCAARGLDAFDRSVALMLLIEVWLIIVVR